MYLGMLDIDFKAAGIMISICTAIGVAIQYFTGFYWLTATLLVVIVIFINGAIIFNEDLEPDGFDYQKGVTDTPEAKADQRKVNVTNFIIIVALIGAAVWSYI